MTFKIVKLDAKKELIGSLVYIDFNLVQAKVGFLAVFCGIEVNNRPSFSLLCQN